MFRSESSDSGPAVDSKAAPVVKPGPVLVSVCVSCRSTDGQPSCSGNDLIATLHAAFAPEDGDVTMRPVQCLSVCKRQTTVAVSAPDGYTFLFGDLDVTTGAAALAAFVRSYRQSGYGMVPWHERPEVLRRRLIARVPPASWSPPDGRAPT
jgi:predicted metal-binding protein